MGFWPAKNTIVFFILQTINWLLLAAGVILAIKDRYDAAASDDPDQKVLDLFPLYVGIAMAVTRNTIIAIRYTTSSVGLWLQTASD